jgi:hypothetical protein
MIEKLHNAYSFWEWVVQLYIAAELRVGVRHTNIVIDDALILHHHQQ